MHNWKRIVQDRLALLHLEPTAELDLVEELSQHLEDVYRELRSSGADDEEAYRSAVSELKDTYALRTESVRAQRMPQYDFVPPGGAVQGRFPWIGLIDILWRDVRYATRILRKAPVFVLIVVLMLGLGIGANTTVFTVINTLILNPLPVPDPSGLAAVGLMKPGSTPRSGAPLPLSYADLKDYQARNRVFRALAGYTSSRPVTRQDAEISEGMFGQLVTSNYFSTLGIKPVSGRFFLPDEDATPGAHAVAVINYGTWQSRFGSAAGIIGKTVRLNHVDFTIIGIAPRHFIGVNGIFGPDVWVPASMAEALFPNEMQGALSNRGKVFFQGVGRLNSGISMAQAQANMNTLAADLGREYPAVDEGYAAMVVPIRDVLLANTGGSSTRVLAVGTGLLIVVGIVLLIACSNVANLLLAR
jgi:predicted permease